MLAAALGWAKLWLAACVVAFLLGAPFSRYAPLHAPRFRFAPHAATLRCSALATAAWAAELLVLTAAASWLGPMQLGVVDAVAAAAHVPVAPVAGGAGACVPPFRCRFAHPAPRPPATGEGPSAVVPVISKRDLELVLLPISCAAAASWLGAAAGILDWAVWWQVWPVPSTVLAPLGALIGLALQFYFHSSGLATPHAHAE